MSNPRQPLAPPPDHDRIVNLVKAEYNRRSSPEQAFRNVSAVINLWLNHPEQALPAVGQGNVLGPVERPVPEEPRAEEPRAEEPRAEELPREEPQEDPPSQQDPPLDDPEKVEEPEKESEQAQSSSDRKRCGQLSNESSSQKRPKTEETSRHDSLEGTSSRPIPCQESDDSKKNATEGDGKAKKIILNLEQYHWEDRELELYGEALQAPRNHPESPDLPAESQEPMETSEQGPPGATTGNEQGNREGGTEAPTVTSSDIDSDDERIDALDIKEDTEEVPEQLTNFDFGVFTLEVVRNMYRILAADEFEQIKQLPLALEHIPIILHLRKFTRVKLMRLPFDVLEVTIAHRQIFFIIRHTPTGKCTIVQYISVPEGCSFRYMGLSVLIEGIKYQSLAAKDFFYLVRHPGQKLRTLIINIAKHEAPAVYPFRSFFRKLGNYFKALSDFKLKTVQFYMTTFYYEASGEQARKFIDIFWKNLDPTLLMSVSLRVWDDQIVRGKYRLEKPADRNLTKDLYTTEQWRNLKQLDIYDENIEVDPMEYTNFIHLKNIAVYTPLNDEKYDHFKGIVRAFGQMEHPDEKQDSVVVVPDHNCLQKASNWFLSENNLVKLHTVDWRTPRLMEKFRNAGIPNKDVKTIYLVDLPNEVEMQLTGTWRRDNGVEVKLMFFKIPMAGDTSVEDALKADAERSSRFDPDTLPLYLLKPNEHDRNVL